LIQAWGIDKSALGPLDGGLMLARNMPVQDLFYVASGLVLIGLAAAVALTPLYRTRIQDMVREASQAR
jgi:hypothetical protein